jgi:hypothetical protein
MDTLTQLKLISEQFKNGESNNHQNMHGLSNEELVSILENSCNEIMYLREKMSEYQNLEIDKKFKFLALNPCTGNYYTQKDAFVMCAKDQAVPATLKTYINECVRLNADENQIKSAQLLLKRVLEFQNIFPTKIPDVSTSREIFVCCQDE